MRPLLGLPGAPLAAAGMHRAPLRPTHNPSLMPTPAGASMQRDAILAFYTGPGLVPRLRNSSSQILLMAGSQDAVVPVATQTQAAAQLVAADLVQVPDAGHVRQPWWWVGAERAQPSSGWRGARLALRLHTRACAGCHPCALR